MVTYTQTCCDPCVGIGAVFVLDPLFSPLPGAPKPMNQLRCTETTVVVPILATSNQLAVQPQDRHHQPFPDPHGKADYALMPRWRVSRTALIHDRLLVRLGCEILPIILGARLRTEVDARLSADTIATRERSSS
jgi:hypothetical protein